MEEQRKTYDENTQGLAGNSHPQANEDQQKKSKDDKLGDKQEEPTKKHGVPDDEEEGSRNGGLRGAENFRRNLGCGG